MLDELLLSNPLNAALAEMVPTPLLFRVRKSLLSESVSVGTKR